MLPIFQQVLDMQMRAQDRGVEPTHVYLDTKSYVAVCMEIGVLTRFPANTDGKAPAEEYLLGMRIVRKRPTIHCINCGAEKEQRPMLVCSYCRTPYSTIEVG